MARKRKDTREEKMLELAKSLLEPGNEEPGEGLENIRRVSLALQMTLLGVSYQMVEKIQDLLQISDKVIERLSDESNLNRMSPRSLVEALKSVSDIVSKYASYASSLQKEVDLGSVEEKLLQVIAKQQSGEDSQEAELSREELAREILEVIRGRVN